jgi:hypothetical protein
MKINKHLKDLKSWKETDLFNWLADNYYNLLVNTNENYSKSDCYDIETMHRIELKCRAKHYDNLIIEKPKYDFLMQKAKQFGDIPVYINSTPKGIYLFNLKNLKLKWYSKELPKTTDFDNNNLIKKEIAEINIKYSLKLK